MRLVSALLVAAWGLAGCGGPEPEPAPPPGPQVKATKQEDAKQTSPSDPFLRYHSKD